MKIYIRCLVLFIILYSSVGTVATAAEETDFRYFGIGAEISNKENSSYNVTTEGHKANEGIVFSPKNIKGSKKIVFSTYLKGKGTFILQIDESDIRGKHIKSTQSEPITLANDWQHAHLDTILSTKTKYTDLTILTTDKTNTTFHFKNVQVNHR